MGGGRDRDGGEEMRRNSIASNKLKFWVRPCYAGVCTVTLAKQAVGHMTH